MEYSCLFEGKGLPESVLENKQIIISEVFHAVLFAFERKENIGESEQICTF
jgi:hypothetical protein